MFFCYEDYVSYIDISVLVDMELVNANLRKTALLEFKQTQYNVPLTETLSIFYSFKNEYYPDLNCYEVGRVCNFSCCDGEQVNILVSTESFSDLSFVYNHALLGMELGYPCYAEYNEVDPQCSICIYLISDLRDIEIPLLHNNATDFSKLDQFREIGRSFLDFLTSSDCRVNKHISELYVVTEKNTSYADE